MDRKQFIKNLSMACAALAVPKIFKINKPAIEEYIGSKGILWHIQHAPVTTFSYSGNLTIADFHEMVRVFENSK